MTFKVFYLQLWQPSCSVERDLLDNFGRGHCEIHFCEIILNLSFRIFLILSSGGHLVRRSGTIEAFW